MTEAKKIQEEIIEEKEPSSLRLIMTLGIAGFFAGLILVAVYLYTKPMIEANKAEALRVAIYKVLPDCASFKTLELQNGQLVEHDPGQEKQQQQGEEPKRIYMGFNDAGEFVGFAIPGAEPGFQDIIGVIFGYDADRKIIIGFEVLESKETPGLGDKIFKDKKFQTNFVALAVEPEILAAKPGEKDKPNEVETITGATISSKAVIRLLNNTMNEWKQAIEDYAETNGLKAENTTP